MHLHQPIRHLTGPIVAVLIAAGLACPALAQDASPAEPSAGTGSAWPPGLPVGTTVEVVAGGDPQADLWVVSPSFATPTRIGPAIVGRFDGTTGIPSPATCRTSRAASSTPWSAHPPRASG